jgi:hypothetical protein
MLGRIAKPIDRLECQRLLICQKFYATITQPAPYARIKPYCLSFALFSNLSPLVQYRSLEHHLEGVIKVDQHTANSAAVVRSIEKLDTQKH